MKLPRDISGRDFASRLARLGYGVDHQTGSHIRLTTTRDGEHHITVPAHDPLKVGMLNAILRVVAEHHKIPRKELLSLLFE